MSGQCGKRKAIVWGALLLAAAMASARVVCEVGNGLPAARIEPRGNYAVAVSQATLARPEWRRVVEALKDKYAADVVVFSEGRPREALPELKRLFPAYVCFVGTPSECGRAFVVAVSRLTRQLDDDPYGDVLWGILTGYTAEDALRAAREASPLVIRSGATSIGVDRLNRLESGFASNEGCVNDFWTKAPGATTAVRRAASPDAAGALAEAFNARGPDVFYTSGHATEHDWQIAYNLPGGAFRCEAGALFAQSTDGRRYPIETPNAKVYLPVGNCLIGHIVAPDCMATAWMHSGGARQMIGYTVVTFYGYMGWGTGLLFEDGRLSLAESFFLNNQALLHRLATRFPQLLDARPESYEGQDIAALSERFAKGNGDALGLLWDRDTVAFYGDPAWVASYPCREPTFGYRLEESDGAWTLRVTVLKPGGGADPKWGTRPFLALLPERLTDIRDVVGEGADQPVVTERFVLVPLARQESEGATATVTFKAKSVHR